MWIKFVVGALFAQGALGTFSSRMISYTYSLLLAKTNALGQLLGPIHQEQHPLTRTRPVQHVTKGRPM